MSTQDGSGIEFAVMPEEHQQRFRLLELPQELLSGLVSAQPITLTLKSCDSQKSAESSAVLCTQDKTYSVRQVNTSNSLFVALLNDSATNPQDGLPQTRLEAISKATSILEVIPSGTIAYEEYLKTVLPTYTSTGYTASNNTKSKSELLSNVPFSDGECQQAWTHLACFEHGEPPRSFVPSDDVRWKVWQMIKTSFEADCLDLTSILSGADRVSIQREVDDWPSELLDAVLKSVCSKWTETSFQIDGEKCARFVGVNLLREKTRAETSISTDDFIESWKAHLPRAWEDLAHVGTLAPHYRLENDGKHIIFVQYRDLTQDSLTGPDVKSTAGAKRKWHEKFRTSKRSG